MLNSVAVLTLVYFLNHGLTLSHSITAPSMDACQTAISPLAAPMIGKEFEMAGHKYTILDVQGYCKKFERHEHA